MSSEKQHGTSSILLPALCIIWNLSVNSNWSYSLETPNSGQNMWFLVRVNSKFDGWPWKIIGHLFYTTSRFVHHFKAIGAFKLEFQSRNVPFGSKPWTKIGRLFYATSSFNLCLIPKPWVNSNWNYCPETLNSDHNLRFLFHVTLKFAGWLCERTGHLFKATSSFVHHFIVIGENSNWSYSTETPNLGPDRRICNRVTLKCDGWCRQTTGHLF